MAHEPLPSMPPKARRRGGARTAFSWECASSAGDHGLRWLPVARAVRLEPPPAGSPDALRIDDRMAEAMECAGDAARYRRFPPAPEHAPSSVVDVVAVGLLGDTVFLLTLVHDDPTAAAYAALRVLHQALVWSWAYEQDREGLARAIDAIPPPNLFGLAWRRQPGPFELRPIVAFDAPPELVTVRRTFTLLRELAPLDPSGIVRTTELRAVPAGGGAFRIPERVARTNKRRCPTCASPYVVPVVFGLPSAEGQACWDRGELDLGGCLVMGDEPDWRCRACGAEW